ncbi:transmembrane protein 231 [Daktulosphaira vitifoliae]|uniref:transmembrane protein 231 n=1 Tax=Daktulosphaira vitifoliae TaxID=58002 RepID=UPI0021A979F2|nr:transmembrane protein 231 [Daktulosphaira vitifoliae]
MSVFEVYKQSLSVKYKASLCSKAFLLYLVIVLLTFFLPFLFCYKSHGLWLKYDKYLEQPEVEFKFEYLLISETSDPLVPLICGIYPEKVITTGFCPMIKVAEEDRNMDGIKDNLNFQLNLMTNETFDINSVTLLLFFNFKIHELCLLEMESMAVITHSSAIPGGKLDLIGDLKLVQKTPLDCSLKNPIRMKNSILQFETSDWLFNIYKDYLKRSIYTKLDNVLFKWTKGRSYQQPFIINVKINYDEVEIVYKPKFWQIIKWAWMQYFSILILTLFIFKKVKRFLFTNHIVNTRIAKLT